MSQRDATQRFVFRRMIQPYWRMQRGLTLGAQGIVVEAATDGATDGHRVLLVKHSYRPGWCFPGGGVEKGETVATALARELDEEAGVALDGPPDLFGIYSNERAFPGDHVVLYLVRSWRRLRVPEPTREIVAQDFFAASSPPPDCDPATARRLAEVFGGAPRDALW